MSAIFGSKFVRTAELQVYNQAQTPVREPRFDDTASAWHLGAGFGGLPQNRMPRCRVDGKLGDTIVDPHETFLPTR